MGFILQDAQERVAFSSFTGSSHCAAFQPPRTQQGPAPGPRSAGSAGAAALRGRPVSAREPRRSFFLGVSQRQHGGRFPSLRGDRAELQSKHTVSAWFLFLSKIFREYTV